MSAHSGGFTGLVGARPIRRHSAPVQAGVAAGAFVAIDAFGHVADPVVALPKVGSPAAVDAGVVNVALVDVVAGKPIVI